MLLEENGFFIGFEAISKGFLAPKGNRIEAQELERKDAILVDLSSHSFTAFNAAF